jgi:hypothetical protein
MMLSHFELFFHMRDLLQVTLVDLYTTQKVFEYFCFLIYSFAEELCFLCTNLPPFVLIVH